MKPNDDNFDRLISQHFERTLAKQLGRSEAAFRNQLRVEAQPARSMKFPLWLVGTFATAAAALWAVAMLRPIHLPPVTAPPLAQIDGPRDVVPPQVIASTSPQRTDVSFVAYEQTVDDGVVYLDDQTPVRKFRRQELEQMQWLDDDGKTHMRLTVPKERVLFVECAKY